MSSVEINKAAQQFHMLADYHHGDGEQEEPKLFADCMQVAGHNLVRGIYNSISSDCKWCVAVCVSDFLLVVRDGVGLLGS